MSKEQPRRSRRRQRPPSPEIEGSQRQVITFPGATADGPRSARFLSRVPLGTENPPMQCAVYWVEWNDGLTYLAIVAEGGVPIITNLYLVFGAALALLDHQYTVWKHIQAYLRREYYQRCDE